MVARRQEHRLSSVLRAASKSTSRTPTARTRAGPRTLRRIALERRISFVATDGSRIVYVRNGSSGRSAPKRAAGRQLSTRRRQRPAAILVARRLEDSFVRNWASHIAQVYVMDADGTNQVNLSTMVRPEPRALLVTGREEDHLPALERNRTMDPDGRNQTQSLSTPNNPFGMSNHPSGRPTGRRSLSRASRTSPHLRDETPTARTRCSSPPTGRTRPGARSRRSARWSETQPAAGLRRRVHLRRELTNNHAADGHGPDLTEVLPAGTTLILADPSRGSCSGVPRRDGEITCSFPDLARARASKSP